MSFNEYEGLDPSFAEACRKADERLRKRMKGEEPPPVNGPEDYGVGGSSFKDEPEKIDLPATFTFLGDAPAAAPRELIKKLLPAYGVAVTGGQPSAGKTFIEMHKAVCLAKSLPFFGRKIAERAGTAFVAAEGRALIPNRFAAALAKQSITEKLPIAWIKQLPDFSSAIGIRLFVRQLKALDERFHGDFGVRLGQVTIDTVAACFGMKNEDDNAEATKVCNIMRSIGEDVGALMAPVHHYGKNPESGLRGASAWRGCADIVQGVLADIDPLTGRASNRELVCAKARDGEEGPISAFALEFMQLGIGAGDEIYGSCCVVPADGKSRFDKATGRNKGERTIQDAINEALDGQGKIITPRADMAAVKATKVIDVRAEFDRRIRRRGGRPRQSRQRQAHGVQTGTRPSVPRPIQGRLRRGGRLDLENDMLSKPLGLPRPCTTHTHTPL
jgi:AAA domain